MKSLTQIRINESANGTGRQIGNWLSALLFMVMLLTGAILPQSALSATPAEINSAIAKGVTWLLAQQVAGAPARGSLNGSFNDKGTSYGGYPNAATAFAVAALEHDAEHLGQTVLGTYANKTAVLNGLNYLFANANYDSANDWVSWDSGSTANYEAGMVLMAITRSGTPDEIVNIGPFAGLNFTYKQVAQKAINFMAAGQQTTGAWGYGFGISDNYRDQSITGWSAMGLGYAKHSMDCTIPNVTITRLATHNAYIQNTSGGIEDGGAGYTGPTNEINAYKTGHLLYDQYMEGKAVSDSAVKKTLAYFDRNWNETCGSGASGYGWKAAAGTTTACYTAMFTSTKGFGAYEITTFGATNRDWYADFAQEIVNNQLTDPAVPNSSHWIGNGYIDGNPLRGTAHALLTLLKATSTPLTSNITTPTGARYGLNQNLDFVAKYSGIVDVTGTPRFKLTIGSTDRYAPYLSGTGTTDLTFRYTTQATDNDLDGIAMVSPMELNGGTMKDRQATPLDVPLTFVAPNTSAVLVDTLAPTVSSTGASALHLFAGASATATYTFSEPVSGVTATNFSIVSSNLTGISSVGTPACSSGSAPCTIWNIPISNVGSLTTGSSGTLHLDLANGTGIVDSASPTNAMASGATYTGTTVTVYNSISLSPSTLPTGVLTVSYSGNSVTASGGSGTFTNYAITSGSIPGITLGTNGSFSGTPTTTGSYPLTIRATDSNGLTGSRSYTVDVVNTHRVSTNIATGSGTFTPTSIDIVHGQTTTLSIASATGSHITNISGCSGTAYTPVYTVGVDGVTPRNYTTGAITADCTVSASFAVNRYNVTTSVTGGTGGTLTCPQSIENYGATPTCTITPDTGYHLYELTEDGTSRFSNHSITGDNSTQGSLQLAAIVANKTVNAQFRKNTYLVSVSKLGVGSGINAVATTSLAANYADYGSSATFNINETDGSQIDAVTAPTACGTLTGSPWSDSSPAPPSKHSLNNTYTVTGITGPCTVTATFNTDTTKPVVTVFSFPATVTAITSPIAMSAPFTATDNVHVKDFCVVQYPADSSSCTWNSLPPTGFTLTGSEGPKTLFGYARDYANNISTAAVAHITFDSFNRVNLPRTGQNRCYDAAGNLLATCLPNGKGQDGNIIAGAAWPATRFAAATSTGVEVVTDNLTGLMFPRDFTGAIPTTMTWSQALAAVDNLNATGFAGFSDWRLPNRNEMASLVNRQRSDSAAWLNLAAQGFNNVKSSPYWSNSTDATDSSKAWTVNMLEGSLLGLAKTGVNYAVPVRAWQGMVTVAQPLQTGQSLCYDTTTNLETPCVNGVSGIHTGQDGDQKAGTPWPSTRFTNADGSALSNNSTMAYDRLTNLVWPTDAGTPACNSYSGPLSWQQSLDYVTCLNTAIHLGYNDWRLPNTAEFLSLYNAGQSDGAAWLNSTGFKNVDAASTSGFWSSTTDVNKAFNSWVYNATNGALTYNNKINTSSYVWPVRGGLVNGSAISVSPSAPDLGQTPYGSTSQLQELVITNTGTATLQVSSVILTGTDAAMFSINTNGGAQPCGNAAPSIAVGGSCTVTLSNTPATAGSKSATLTITSSDPSNPVLDLLLSGTGVSTISGSSSVGGSTLCTPAQVTLGGSSSCVMFPSTGYHLTSVSDNGSARAVSSPYNLSNISIHHNIAAGFTINSYAVNVNSPTNGTISCPAATHGSSAICTITPATGYQVASLTDNSVDVTGAITGSNPYSYTIGSVTEVHAVAVTFTIKTYPISGSSGANGSITCPAAPVAHGSSASCTMTPATGYHLATLTDNGSTVTASSPYSINPVTAPHNIAATFAINQYTVTIPVVTGGTSSPANSLSLDYGASSTIVLTPSSGYTVNSSAFSGCPGTASGNIFTLAPITANCTLATGYTPITTTVTASAGSGGSISPSSRSVGYNAATTFTVTPDTGFSVLAANGCGGTMTAPGTYTTAGITSACDVLVTFHDGQSPVISSFALPTVTYSLTLPIPVFETSDNKAVTGWYISDTAALPTNPAWDDSKPISYTFAKGTVPGDKTLYAWVRDEAGNISTMASAPVEIYFPSPTRLIQTGQATCYDANGAIACASPDVQDGYIKSGLRWDGTNRFIDNGNDSYTDTVSGLMWAQHANVVNHRNPGWNGSINGTVSWQQALDYVAKLNSEIYLGYSDWRLPNKNELLSVMNYSSDLSSWLIARSFYEVPSVPVYWASTSVPAPAADHAYALLNNGAFEQLAKSAAALLIPVRTDDTIFQRTIVPVTGQTACFNAAGASRPCVATDGSHTGEDGDMLAGIPAVSPRFVQEDGSSLTVNSTIVLDQSTGLSWLRDGSSPACGSLTAGSQTFANALEYVKCLNSNAVYGKTDWRLANSFELSSIINSSQNDNSNWLSTSGFRNVAASYWSSDSVVPDTPATKGFMVNMSNFSISIDAKTSSHGVWPVRGGFVSSGAPFSLSANAINFGTVPGLTVSDPVAFIITNDTNANLTITETSKSGADASLFSFDPNGGPHPCGSATFTLPPYGSCTMALTFTANFTGARTATLAVKSTLPSHTVNLPLSANGGLNTYNITVNSSAGGVLDCEPLSAVLNSNVTCTVIPDRGKKLSALTDNNVDVFQSVSNDIYTISSVSSEHTLTPVFDSATPNITVSINGSGTVTPGSGTIAYGNSRQFTVTPTAGNRIVSVTGCAGTLGGSTYTTGSVTADCTVTANFAINNIVVTTASGGNGTVSCVPDPADYGSDVTCTITPATGYSLSSFTDNGVDSIASVSTNKYSLTNVMANHALVAAFAINHYTITSRVVSSGGGSITPVTTQTLDYLQTASFNTSSNAGYHLTGFASGSGFCEGTRSGSSFTISGATADCIVEAVFAKNSYNVITAKSPAAGGTITPETVTATPYLDSVAIGAAAATGNGYHIVSIQGCGIDQSFNGNGTTTYNGSTAAVTADCTVNAVFALNSYTITSSVTGSGTITPTGNQSATHGSSVSFTVAPALPGNRLKDITGTCSGTLSGSTYTIAAATGTCTVIANFEPLQYTVTASGTNIASFEPASPFSVNHGLTRSIVITPATGYNLTTASGCGGSLNMSNNTYTTAPITADCSITATTAPKTYSIQTVVIPAGEGHQLTGTTSTTYNQTITLGVVPAAGYSLLAINGCGGTYSTATSSYTTAPMTDTNNNCSVTATFALNSYTVTTSGSNISFSPANPVKLHGQTAAITITPDQILGTPGYDITSVTGCSGNWNPTTSVYTTAILTGNCTVAVVSAIKTRTVTSSAGANGSITASATHNYGTSPVYAITPITGYHVVDVLVDGSSVGPVSSYSFSGIIANHTISATFAINTYTVTATSGANGTITDSATHNYGTSPVYTITPNTGYHIVSVLVDGSSVGAVTSHTFSNVAANHTISATFAINTYTVTASANAGGTITDSATHNYGTSPVYTITPNTGYHIVDVLVDDSSVGAVTSHTFTAISANHTISATFAINTYTITASAGSGGSITPTGANSVNHGSSLSFTITPDTGYHIVNVLINGTPLGPLSSFNFSSVTTSYTITAVFAINTYTVTASAGANGSITPTATHNYGTSPVYSITPATGYHIVDVLVDGSSVGTVTSHTFSNISAGHTITATFAINTYTVTASANAGGTITPSATYNHGASPVYTITPNTGYHIVDVLVDGSSAGAAGSHTFTSMAADHTISATFAINTFTVTATASAGGSITASANHNYGTSPVYTISPNAGYHIVDVMVDGLSVGAVTSYTFSTITAPHTIAATFAINTYTVTATAGANGSITPTATHNYGTSPVYTITPATGYHIVSVLVDGSSVGTAGSYTFSNIAASHTISATFAIDTFAVSITVPTNGTIACTPATVSYGGSIICTLTPVTGYKLTALTDNTDVKDVTAIKDGGNYTMSNVTANHTITATFEAYQWKATPTLNGVGATLTPTSVVYVDNGAQPVFTLLLNEGFYSPSKTTSCGMSEIVSGSSTAITIHPMYSDCTLTVNISSYPGYLKLITSAGTGGTISPTAAVASGSNRTVTVTPSAGYHIISVTDNGTPLTVTDVKAFSYNLTVTADHNFVATFGADMSDFNNDGKADIIWTDTTTNNSIVWFMDGVTKIGEASLPAAPGADWAIVGKGDFNRDGHTDILWRNQVTGQNLIWYMDGVNMISQVALPTYGAVTWKIVGTGDFNGDGNTDIIWRKTSTGQQIIWYLNSGAVTSSASLPTYAVNSTDWNIVGVGDFNRDGKPDILWRQTSTGKQVLWYVDNTTVNSSTTLPTYAVGSAVWSIVGVGDFNKDGNQDILWRNYSTGKQLLWYMNNSTVTSSALFTDILIGSQNIIVGR